MLGSSNSLLMNYCELLTDTVHEAEFFGSYDFSFRNVSLIMMVTSHGEYGSYCVLIVAAGRPTCCLCFFFFFK